MGKDNELQLAIIGGGIAGITAAIYAKRAGLNPVVFESSAVGGQILWIDKIDNYPGIGVGSKGYELVESLNAAVKELNISIYQEKITEVKKNADKFSLAAENQQYHADAVIIATGASFKRLNVAGEASLVGKGVSWCAVCDGFFFRNKQVAVIGGGNTAVEEALYLSSLAQKVYLIHRRDKLRALDYLQKRITETNNIKILWNKEVEQIKGDDFVEGLQLKTTGSDKREDIDVNAVFIAIGVKPNTGIVNNLIDLDQKGFILTDKNMSSSLKGLFACGDCRQRPIRQLVTAASEGAIAAVSVYRYLRGNYISS
jgi:thioredoxin reductase (NADPH)